ncbi:helix-turn-helix transcriptional regulator [Lentzea chajnantorensis]
MNSLMPTRQPDDLLTTAEVAAHVRVPEKTVVGWRSKGTGPAFVRYGRHVRYRWADVLQWVAAQRVAA